LELAFVSENGDSLGLATHLSSEGHAVKFFIRTECALGLGIVSKEALSGPADITIFDSPMLGQDADVIRREGHRVLGSSHWVEMIDKNDEYARQLIEIVGWDKTKLTNGVNLYITTWFNGTKFVSTYASLVYRRLMSGGHGPDLGCAGVLGNFWQPTDIVYSKILKPLESVLRRVNHRGCFHIHTLVSGEKFDVKGISASLSSPLSTLLFENSKNSSADVILRLLDENSKPIRPLEKWSAAILISVPPYPYALPAEPFVLSGLQPKALKHLWLIDAKKEDDVWSSAGFSGKVGYVTSRGVDPQEATRRAYRTIDNLRVRDLQFRNDVGRDIHNLLKGLRSSRWIK